MYDVAYCHFPLEKEREQQKSIFHFCLVNGGEKKKKKKSGAIFSENIFPVIVLCSLLWNDPRWRKQNTRIKWSFSSLSLNSKPDGVFDSGCNVYKEWLDFYRKSQVVSSKFCFFLFLLSVLCLSLTKKLISRKMCIVN